MKLRSTTSRSPILPILAALMCAMVPTLARGQVDSGVGSGPCVLLKNDNVLFGRAHQLGEFIVIRTGPNDELRLPRAQVACWAKSLQDLYRYRLDHRQSNDLQSHLREARWCLQYELFDLAAKELAAAEAISPTHAEVVLLQGQFKRRANTREPKPAVSSSIATTAFLQKSFPSTDDLSRSEQQLDAETLKGFASHVQPVLINRCGRCHKHGSELLWKLAVPIRGMRPTARLTRENLVASLEFINPTNPIDSPLFIQATTPHGGVDAPLGPRNAKAIDAFRRWLARPNHKTKPSDDRRSSRTQQSTSKPNQPIADVAQVAYTSEVATIPKSFASAKTDGAKNNSLEPKSAGPNKHPHRLPTVANPFRSELVQSSLPPRQQLKARFS